MRDGDVDTGVLNSAVGGAVTARFFLDSGAASNSNNKLSPSSVASAVAAAAAATASSLSAAQMSSSSSNLLSPRTHIAKKQYLVENQTKNPASSHQNQQAMLKQMQKKVQQECRLHTLSRRNSSSESATSTNSRSGSPATSTAATKATETARNETIKSTAESMRKQQQQQRFESTSSAISSGRETHSHPIVVLPPTIHESPVDAGRHRR